MNTYIRSLSLPDEDQEFFFLMGQKMTCYNSIYPFKIFPQKELARIRFAPVTVLCGSNGCGKTTLLNLIAELAGVQRYSTFGGGAFFGDYMEMCRLEGSAPEGSCLLTSDDVFDWLLDLRRVSRAVDDKREALFADYTEKKYARRKLASLEDYDDWKTYDDAKRKTKSRFVNENLAKNPEMHSNGESAMHFFVERITENALYLLDEPENSLSVPRQLELRDFLADSARHFGCQIILSTHSPVLLSLPGAEVWDLDAQPVCPRPWTDVPGVRASYEFFKAHADAFEGSSPAPPLREPGKGSKRQIESSLPPRRCGGLFLHRTAARRGHLR